VSATGTTAFEADRARGAASRLTLRIAAETAVIRPTLPVLLAIWPLDRVLAALDHDGDLRADRRTLLSTVERVTDLATRRRWPLGTACLQRALLRYALLRRHGIQPRFVIGVRPGGRDGFEAHAWLTLDGAPIMERESLGCRTTFEWPPSCAR
jgi:hypothetical protein